jgi:hypothetical protein
VHDLLDQQLTDIDGPAAPAGTLDVQAAQRRAESAQRRAGWSGQ